MDAQAGANTPGWLHHPATRLEQASTDVLEKKMTAKDLWMRPLLPFAKWYCANVRMSGPTNSGLIARANRELRYDRLNSTSGRHARKWSDAIDDYPNWNSHLAKHPAYVRSAEEEAELMLRKFPLMLSDRW